MTKADLKIIQGRGGLRVDHWQRVQRAQIELENLPYFDPPVIEDDNRGAEMLGYVILYALCVLSGLLLAAWWAL